MIKYALLLMAALLGPFPLLTDTVTEHLEKRDGSPEQSEERDIYMSVLCSPLPVPLSPSSSVHTLQPADISAVYTLGITPSQREEASRVVSRLTELLSVFNPDVTVRHQTSVQSRSLIEEAEELSLSLSHQESEWKLVLLFIPTGSMCACSPHVSADVKAAVQEVEGALQIIKERLRQTLLHVVIWSEYHPQDMCDCMQDTNVNHGLLRATLLKTLQDSINHMLQSPKWQSPAEDFTAVLQPTPVIIEPNLDPPENPFPGLNQLTLQLWTNLLQPSTSEEMSLGRNVFAIPCPTQERPFLQTETNSPSERVMEICSRSLNLTDPVMGSELPCTDRNPSPHIPISVHELRPGDIKVVAAVGDSLTAGNGVGAKTDNLLLVINEYRGLSWSIGGDGNISNVTTLPNILREFNPSLTGFSEGIGKEDDTAAFLNQAVAGAKAGDMVRQVRVLVDKMKNDSRIDFHNDWKVITMFIGGNDICDFCTDTVIFSPRNVVNRIQEALDVLQNEVPRAVVNLVELLNIVPLRDLHKDSSLGCPTWFVKLVCPCILKATEESLELQKVNDFNRAYQYNMRELIDSGRYDTHHNFTVVLQPFFREIFLPVLEDGRPDRSYFTPDCFHLSQKAHTLMARALWNNMLEPVGNKTFRQDFTADIELKCPSKAEPFIKTAVNSNYSFPGPPPTPTPVTNWGSDIYCVNMAPSDAVPTSAHRVRPADIKVVAALGDSITAGFGAKAKNLLQLQTEYRGVSWSIGGDKTLETVTTLPNILRKFNPEIKGVSKGQGKWRTGFNMAVSGAKISGIPEQVRRLIDTMKRDSTVDFHNDWKLVTLFIGGNDLCQYCNDRVSLSPQNYTHHMMTSLDILYEEVPRTIVNVLEILEIEGLRRIQRDSLGCSVLQKYVCPCFLLGGDDSPELAEVKRVNRQIQVETEKLVYGGRYDHKEDFAVVAQPFLKNTVVPLNADGRPDTTYFSEDCFHFSERGHADMAAALWNNMLEAVGHKQTYNNFTNTRNNIKCPTEDHPFIFTKMNSLPSSTTTTAPTASTAQPPASTTAMPSTQTTAQPFTPNCLGKLPVWFAALLAVFGLLIGCAVTAIIFSYKAKKTRKMITTVF